MSKREELEAKISENLEKIRELKAENRALVDEGLFLSDDKQWFIEKMEMTTQNDGRKKIQVERLIGRIHWNEDFKDEDTDNVITVTRSQIVRVDGKMHW